MYQTRGIQTIATITELRSETADLVDHARRSGNGVLIQKNNEPKAVLLSFEKYEALIEGSPSFAENGHA